MRVFRLELIIAMVGVFGFLSYTLSQPAKELAIRMTVGALWSRILFSLFRQLMIRALVGVAADLLLAWWLVRGFEALLFQILPHDPVVFASGSIAADRLRGGGVDSGGPVVEIDPATSLHTE